MTATTHRARWRRILGIAALMGATLAGVPAWGDELQVVSSGGFASALRTLAPDFERMSGDRLSLAWGPSMGTTRDAIPNRLARGERPDVVVMVDGALDALIRGGQVEPDSKTVLARSLIAVAVQAGAPRPDITDIDALKRTLLAARAIAYSDSASGVYLSTVLFPRLGLVEALRGKSHMIAAEPVGQVVARGEADLGFQQLSELRPVTGIDIVGLLPEAAQQVTLFCAGVVSGAGHTAAARRLVDFLGSRAAAPVVRASGLEPAGDTQR
jgi:molybdate transport system substrate-binding protein